MNWLARWKRVWFRAETTMPLEVVRIGVALGALILYGSVWSELPALYGNEGWVSREALNPWADNPWTQSLLYYFTAPGFLQALYLVLLVSAVALLLGWRTRWVKWLVLIAHVSLLACNPHIYYGVDGILASLLLILCLAPIGQSLSLDSVRRQRHARRLDLATLPVAKTSMWGFACLRLIQIQMAAFYFYAGVEKVQGDSWWHGSALWIALNNQEYANIPIGWMAEHVWMVNLLSYYTILLELAYPFLIWGRSTRPYLLVMAILLHVGIAVMMGLYVFSLVMIAGHLAFLRHEWLAEWGRRWKSRIGPMEMIYDGQCGFCKRSMAWLLAFDGLGQISVRDYRRDPSPVVSSELVDKALYVVMPDGRNFPGFDAYRHVVLRVPGLWWMIPLFYIPVLSRAVGRRAYNWIATHRQEISACGTSSTCSTDRPEG